MRKTIFLFLFCCYLTNDLLAQDKYYTKTGNISFFSEAPLENIEATNNQAVSFLDIKTGEMVFSVPMKAFQFQKSLMQEHFNENYVESHKYPKSTFKGKILNINMVDLSQNKVYKVKVEGDLTIHGVTKAVSTEGLLEIKGNKLNGKSKFSVTPEEFEIHIPALVKNHVAKRIDINVDMTYEPYTGTTP